MSERSFFCPGALTAEGWRENLRLRVDDSGIISELTCDEPAAEEDERLAGTVLAGMVNLHSHAFQRGLIGMTGLSGKGADSFWSWREAMYRQVERFDPRRIEAIGRYVYMEMLRAGYTRVAEFHYLHHPPAGGRYNELAENSNRMLAAAAGAGIGICLLPVFYHWGGFGEQPLNRRQRAFGNSLDDYLEILRQVSLACQAEPLQDWGAAPHSLRAVSPDELRQLTAVLAEEDFRGPLHIHIAEQQAEVEQCRQVLGGRPVQWLLDNVDVDERWCLVHATHVDAQELRAMRAAGVVAGLCPTTEADLGDGIFPARAWQAAGGAFGIGSDSNLRIDVCEELRLLEYGQRLRDQQRNLLAAPGEYLATRLYQDALAGGLQAVGCEPACGLAVGQRADFLVLDDDHPLLAGKRRDRLLEAWLFAGGPDMIAQTWVAGGCLVERGRHRHQEQIEADWRAAVRELFDGED